MEQNRLIKLIVGFFSFLSVVLIFGCAFYIIHGGVKKATVQNQQIEKERQEKLEAQSEIDPDSEKVLLTEEYLRTEYEAYYKRGASTTGVFKTMLIFFDAIVVLMSVGAVVTAFFRARRKGSDLSIFSIIVCLSPIPFTIIFSLFFASFLNTMPKPSKSTMNVEKVYITGVDTTTTHDSDGDSHTSYYIIYTKDGQRESRQLVNSAVYYSVGEPGDYYMCYAKKGITTATFAVYPTDKYEWSGPLS